jgi:hypothetical protein
MKYRAQGTIKRPTFGVGIFTPEAIRLTTTNTQFHGCTPEQIEGEGVIYYVIDALPFLAANYSVWIAIKDQYDLISYDRWENACSFRILEGSDDSQPRGDWGIFNLKEHWEL